MLESHGLLKTVFGNGPSIDVFFFRLSNLVDGATSKHTLNGLDFTGLKAAAPMVYEMHLDGNPEVCLHSRSVI